MRHDRVSHSHFAAALLALALAGCTDSRGAPKPVEAERPVLVTIAHYEDDQQSSTFVAAIRPRIESDVGFRVGGKIMARLVEVGQFVNAGTPLARLDDTDLRLQRDQFAADLAAAERASEQTTADEQRSLELRKSGWTSFADLDRARTAAQEARTRKARSQRALELADNALAYATLRADADGIVTATSIEPGQVVAAGQPVVRLAGLAEKEAVIAVPESAVELARTGEASVTLWAAPDRVYRANLREMAPIADQATRTFTAKFTLPEADAAVRLGMSATVTIRDPKRPPVARIPLAALFNQGQGPSVFVVTGGNRLVLTPVDVARYTATQAEIRAGIPEGATLVALGVHKLDAGQKVKTVAELGL
jgi:RND family efflux transporter MFP subunit